MKFLYGYFDQKTGKSKVALSNKNGIYIGEAKLHPEDKDNVSHFVGCRLAEKRAWINFLKKQLYRKKIQLDTIRNLNKDIKINCGENIDSKVQRRIKLKLRDYTNEIIEIEDTIKELQKTLKQDIKIRDRLLNKNKKDS